MTVAVALKTIVRTGERLRQSKRGVALLEFGLALPALLTVGLYGAETANLALVNMRVSQIALNLADNASRVGTLRSDNTKQLREIDINDVLTAARLQGENLELTKRGRITLSSLEQNAPGVQYLHWQRCLGLRSGADYDSNYDRTYGTIDRDDGTVDAWWAGGVYQPNGMGDAGTKINSPVGSGVMIVEVSYQYKPIVTAAWLPGGNTSTRIRYSASFVVRDRRDFTQIYNPAPAAPRYYCDTYTEN